LFQNEYCLYCDSVINPKFSWGTFLTGPSEKILCDSCRSHFERIDGEICEICSRTKDEQFQTGNICNDCLTWETQMNWKGVLKKNISLFKYNEFMAQFIARFKFRGDYILAKVFSEALRKAIQTIRFDFIVPIPLSEERLYERGFNQTEALLIEANIKYSSFLSRVDSE